ncbi:hypothetical protein [Paenibacillus piri]|uniref:Uncharacterized protein n=1 Tax=Paenibacillus piri TaxID=2547395 RepID=A0A4R5KFI3_9BACL|nr:hypothetical protein [Paenibacillus piri]TDF94141.1 hypothetical protein E1757_24950 [Paenibacillus piri]
MAADRLQFQIKEIAEESPMERIEKPVVEFTATNNKKEDRKAEYRKIFEAFDMKTAVTLMLKLNKEFGGHEAVLNEYLLSLQFGIEMEKYVSNKAEYERQKEIKSKTILPSSFITLAILEQDLLNKINKENSSGKVSFSDNQRTMVQGPPTKESMSPLPDVPKPNVIDVKSKNPVDEILSEIRNMDPNKP